MELLEGVSDEGEAQAGAEQDVTEETEPGTAPRDKAHYVAPKALLTHVRVVSIASQLFKSREQFTLGPFSWLTSFVCQATIDNFQGEESDVVIVSLVRNNDRNNIGFLKVFNRANVMLSRAKHGMYLLGNAQVLEAREGDFWQSVITTLRQRNAVSTQLPIHCQKHPHITQFISRAEDFAAVSPDGGCLQSCGARLECGHACNRYW